MTASESAGVEGPEVTVVATGLRFPEGPIALPDGSVLLVEIARGTVSRVLPDGEVGVVAETGGGPNGLALGPDGRCYVCNNGGFEWREIGGQPVPGLQGEDYEGGRIEAVDLDTGEIEVLYRESNRARPLRGPNDLVFDAHGGFWFTDLGKVRHSDMDRGFVYYAKADGSECREVIRGLVTPNGIGLSPDGNTLYVAETIPGRIWAWDLPEPGVARLDRAAGTLNRGRLVAAPGGYQEFDSLAVDSCGQRVRRDPPPGRDHRGGAGRRRRRARPPSRSDHHQRLFRRPGADDRVGHPERDRAARLVPVAVPRPSPHDYA